MINDSWNPLSARSWARAIGLVHLPLFGSMRKVVPEGEQSVLLDGKSASVAFFSGDPSLIYDDGPLSWSWSSNVKYSLIVNEATNSVFVRAPNAPAPEKRRLPLSQIDAVRLHQEIERSKLAGSVSVISRMLRAFKFVRRVVSPYSPNNLATIQVFNSFLVGAERAMLDSAAPMPDDLPATVSELLAFCEYKDATAGILNNEILNAPVGDLWPLFLDRDPFTNCVLHPDLLIRHASGTLYQEAHFELERKHSYQQMLFGGREPLFTTRGSQQRDARYTPPELARSLVEQVIDSRMLAGGTIEILDPACGCGVFLQESLRELESRGYQGAVTLRGFDTSPLSIEIARFCLDRALADASAAGLHATCEIEPGNAFDVEWGKPDVILMNPPFAGFKDMDAADKAATQVVLDNLTFGHPDKAMAFVAMAAKSLKDKGVLGCVIPSPLLDSTQAVAWRKWLMELGAIRSVGKFTGYSFFSGAMVEPAFLVIDFLPGPPRLATVLRAEQGHESKSLRAIRRGPGAELEFGDEVFLSFDAEQNWFTEASWLPKSQKYMHLLAVLDEMGMPRVGDLFDVKQGALTGNNKVFLISEDEFRRLGAGEKKLFRPAAGSSTIRMGELVPIEYVFYPYNTDEPIDTVDQVKQHAPWFYENRLKDNQNELQRRRNKEEQWWTLTEHRAWQRTHRRKLISAYFGDAGSFAYDQRGEYVVVQGYAWIRSDLVCDDADGEEVSVPFDTTEMPWAYLALLNSRVFEALLSQFCPRVQGGQFNLSKRFVSKVFLPDFLFDNRIDADTIEELARIGSRIAAGQPWNDEELSELSARAYGIHLDAWGLKERANDSWQRPR